MDDLQSPPCSGQAETKSSAAHQAPQEPDLAIPPFLDRRAQGRESWRDHLPVHPAANLFPLMSESELRELGEDIRANGLQQPIVVFCEDWKRGDSFKLLDGRNRLDAMELVGIDFKIRRRRRWRRNHSICLEFSQEDSEVGGRLLRDARCSIEIFAGDEAELQAFVVSVNLHRRHLNVEQRQELLIRLIARQPERSDRQIAKMVGVDHKTIAAARTKGEDVGSIPHVETRTDSRGRKQPATKTKTTKPKPVDHPVTKSSEISLEQRRAENAELDLSAEERAAKASASALAEFTVASRAWLPKVTVEADRQAARNLVATLTCSKCGEAA